MFLRAVALSLALLACGAQAQYKWTDPDGHVAYGDQPPRDAKHVEPLGQMGTAPQGSDALAQLPFEIRRAAKDFPVILYARTDCPPCEEGRAFLKAHAVPFAERTVGTREDIEAFRQLGGGERLPAIAIGRQILRGFEPSSWAEALADAGYPQGIPLPRDWQWSAATPLVPVPATTADSQTAAAPPAAGPADSR
ncbi:Glutaredoxin [Burkholderiales bacterium]|jgi:glutaredoxin|nr:Glutaredoxin [Burkholderiales bacterium]